MEVYNAYSMASVAAGFTRALGVEPPYRAQRIARPLEQLIEGAHCARAVIYNPDAIAQWLWQKYTPDFEEVYRYTSLALPLRAVMPSVTPVCFGTMYTGTLPEVHGIRKYEKPVLRTDSVYDALIRAGKKCAIVSQDGASMSRIFLEREMDYFTQYEAEEDVIAKAEELIASGKYDFISIYNGNYDHTMHGTRVESPEALAVMRKNCRFFGELMRTVESCYKGETFVGFATDHGCHDNPETGRGTHGTDLTDDLNVVHFYGILRGQDNGH